MHRAMVFDRPLHLVLTDEPTTTLKPSDVRVRTIACGVCGSDVSSYLHGHYATTGQILGHEIAGTVEEVGADVTGLTKGDLVAVRTARSCGTCPYCTLDQPYLCDRSAKLSIGYGVAGGLAETVVVRDAVVGVDLFRVPSTVDPDDLVWAEPLAVAVHAVTRAELQSSTSVLITGCGSAGLCVLAAARSTFAGEIVVVEPRADRRAAAASISARAISPDELAREAAQFDVSIDTSGSKSAVTSAQEHVRVGGRLVLIGLSDQEVTWPTKGLDIVPSFAYGIDDFALAVDHIASGRVRLSRFISHRFSLEESGQAIATSAADPSVVKAIVYPNGCP